MHPLLFKTLNIYALILVLQVFLLSNRFSYVDDIVS